MHLRAVALALLLAATTTRAETPAFDGAYTITGKEDLTREVSVELRFSSRADGTVSVERRSRDAAGRTHVLLGAGDRKGDLLRVRYRVERGLDEALLRGGVARGVLAVYRLEGDRLRGLLHSPDRALGWRYTFETGSRARPSTFAPAGDLAFKRVVLCLDGVPWRVLTEMHAKGHFKRFSPPGRMISVFPSLSSIAWNALLQLPPEPGYQAVYYANDQARIMGVTARKMQGSRFQTRMHHRHEGIISHGLAYVAPFLVGRQQLRHMVRELIDHRGSRTAFLYAYQTDPIAHMNGRESLERVLVDIDREVEALMDAFRARHGQELEVVIVSDHGHTLVSGQLAKLEKHLDQHGWRVTKQIRADNECAYTSAGILSSITLHCREAKEVELARIVAGMEGVDLCTWDVGGREQHVLTTKGEGRFRFDPAADAYAYDVVAGQDPLGYVEVFARLRAQGKVDARGFARSADLFQATLDHPYPDAAHRIRVGHTTLVWSPANVLVSLKPGFENGAGLVKLTAGLKGRSGTHGGLDQVNSAGSFMTTFAPTVPGIRPEQLGQWVDLSDYLGNDPAAELSVHPAPGAPERGGLTLEVKDDHVLARSPTTTYRVVLRRSRFLLRDKQVWAETFSAGSLRRDQHTVVIPLAGAYETLEAGKTYKVSIRIEHKDAQGAVRHTEERTLRVGHRGTYQVAD